MITETEVTKLQKAGYMFIRARKTETGFEIEQSHEYGVWETIETFETMDDCERMMESFIGQPLAIVLQDYYEQ
jgi:hypothetical protein